MSGRYGWFLILAGLCVASFDRPGAMRADEPLPAGAPVRLAQPPNAGRGAPGFAFLPDGKLRVRQSRVDKDDPERVTRYKEWAENIAAVESGGGRPAGGGPDKPPVKDRFKQP